jgi:N-acetylglutamate synthase-like GNAT family acetyltransferase
MKIRKATKKDLKEITELSYEYGQFENKLDKNIEIEKDLKKLQKIQEKWMCLGTKYILAQEKDEILGVLSFNIDKRGKEKIGILHTLIVTKEARGKGYGGELVKYALNYFKENRCTRVRTFAHFANKNAQKFWKSKGFELEHGYMGTKVMK